MAKGNKNKPGKSKITAEGTTKDSALSQKIESESRAWFKLDRVQMMKDSLSKLSRVWNQAASSASSESLKQSDLGKINIDTAISSKSDDTKPSKP